MNNVIFNIINSTTNIFRAFTQITLFLSAYESPGIIINLSFEDYDEGLKELRAKVKKEREIFEEEAKRKMVVYESNFQKDNKTEREKIAQRMLLHHYSVEEISRLTDLEETDVIQLKTAIDAFENQERS